MAEVLDVNGWMARITLEMLGQAGLGYSFDNFVEDSTDPYGESLRMFLCVQCPFFSRSECRLIPGPDVGVIAQRKAASCSLASLS